MTVQLRGGWLRGEGRWAPGADPNPPMLMEDDVAPSTGVLDPFTSGASQNLNAPRAGWGVGRWNTSDASWATDSAPTYATNNNVTASNMWATLFGPDMEAGLVEGTVIDTAILILRANSATATSISAGYICRVGWNGIISIETYATTVLSVNTITPPVAGDQFVFQARGPNLTLWRRLATGGSWVIVCSAYNTTYAGTGYIGIGGTSGNNARIADFTGGTIGLATKPYGLAWNADALNNVTIGEQAVGRRVGILFTAPVTANLQSFSCALAYGPGYSAGTGGSTKCALVADDGSVDHFPTGSDLASVTVSTPVGADGTETMQTFTFGSPPAVVAGTRYHIVLESADASPAVNYVSIDETYNTTPTTPVQPAYPDDQLYCNFKYNSGNPWEHLPHNSPSPVNWHFSDGTDFGFSVDYTPVVVAVRNVGGTNRVRETFTAAVGGTFIGGLRVRLYRQSGTTVDLKVELKDGAGNVLYTANVPAASIVSASAAANPAAGTWVGIPGAIALEAGRSYVIELSAVGETVHYQAYPLRTADDANWSAAAKDKRFAEGVWEYSTNSGAAWSRELGEDDYKMQAYFSIVAPVTTTSITCAATQAQAAAYVRTVGHTSPATQAQAAVAKRNQAQIIPITQAQAAVAKRNQTQIVTMTQAQVAVNLRTVPRASSTTQAQAAAQVRQVGHRCSATQTETAACARSPGHTCPATQAQSAATSRSVGRVVAITQAQAAVCAKSKAFIIACAATQAQLANQVRSVGRIIGATQAQSAACKRSAGHVCAATQAQAAACFKTLARVVAATQAQAAVALRSVGRIVATTQTETAASKRTPGHSCAATQPQSAAQSRSVGRIVPATQAQAAATSRIVNRTCSTTQAQVAVCVKIKAVLIVCAATQAQAAASLRSVARLVSATQTETAACSRAAGHTCAATQPQSAATSRSVGHRCSATQPQFADCVKIKAVTVLCQATQAQVAVCKRSRTQTITATQTQAVVVIRSATRSCATTQGQAAACVRGVGHRCAATQPQSASCTVAPGPKIIICQATQAQSASVRRNVGRSSSATQPQLAVVTFTVTHNQYPVITFIFAEPDPRSGTYDNAQPEAATSYTDEPTGGVVSDPHPGEVG